MPKSPFETPVVEGAFRIMPSDIDATKLFLSAFGQGEAEFAALGVVLYCQEQGSWVPFTKDDLTRFFRAARASGRTFPYLNRWSASLGKKTATLDAYHLFMSDREARTWSATEPDTFKFYWLSPEEGLLVRRGDDGKYRVTELFITRCHGASPAKRD